MIPPLTPRFHASLLEPYHQRKGQKMRPPPIPIDGEEELEVERILAEKRTQDGETLYIVRWAGYTPADDTWESLEHVQETQALDECQPEKGKD